ncbi:MAG: hypothetical protein PHD74_04900 [Candidatus Krumholzibacteria bacterium]|nr:hypothetical protein [Candidatus Krumholzibacteria bacterium]
MRCSLCGGENEMEPGQEMLTCSFCGAALALARPQGPEHLILDHKRDNAAAESVLRSFLIENGRKRPTETATEFSFIPFSMMDSVDGKESIAPASRSRVPAGGTPYPPAGQYRFFDESCARGEKVVPIETAADGAVRIVHLPVYEIRYQAGSWKGRAFVIGESWQTIADGLPPQRPRRVALGPLLAATGLFVAYLAIGSFASNALARLALITASSCGAYMIFSLREKASRRT